MVKIVAVHAREILDSRGIPTVEVDVLLETNILGRASVPSGASTGLKEALELRDNDKSRYLGKGVLKAVKNINEAVSQKLVGQNVLLQNVIDTLLIELDGSDNKANLGANAILAVSTAVADAASKQLQIPLYRYIGGIGKKIMPIPMMNVINGGMHANNNIDIQEFMIVPINAKSFKEALRMGSEIFQNLKMICNKKGLATSVGDEGGFAPNLNSNEDAIKLILLAIDEAGYVAGKDVMLALDCAASEFYKDNLYKLKAENLSLTSSEFVDYLNKLVDTYPIISIEDAMSELDKEGWQLLTANLGHKIQLVGDDVFVTNPKILLQGIKDKIANALLVKMNQIGTLSETIKAVEIAKNAGYATIMSHRSGETESTFIADLAVALNCGQIKTGSLSRTDRICKYNQLIRIEEQLGIAASYPGIEVFQKFFQ